MTSGCLIGVETTGVTGNTVAVSSAERPNACRIQGDPPSLVRYHGEPGNYSRHATTYAASMPPRPVRLRVSSPTPSRSPNPPPRPLLLSFSISISLRRKSHPLPSRFVPFFSSKSGSASGTISGWFRSSIFPGKPFLARSIPPRSEGKG